MSGFTIAALAQAGLGISLLIDSILLRRNHTKSVPAYVFWLGVINVFGIAFAPFGFSAFPPFGVMLLAAFSGAIFLVALFCYFRALQEGEASQTVAIVGGFAPLATAIVSAAFLQEDLNIAEGVAAGVLVAGGFLMFLSERINFMRALPWIAGSAVAFAVAGVTEKLVFSATDFSTGFVIMKLATCATAFLLLAHPGFRRQIAAASRESGKRARAHYFGNRIFAGAMSILVFYAVSLDSPLLVEAAGAFKYLVVFIGALILSRYVPRLFREIITRRSIVLKSSATILIIVAFLGIVTQRYYAAQPIPDAKSVVWGVTFSSVMTQRFGLEWKAVLDAILSDLKPGFVRIPVYWDQVEPQEGSYTFDDIDFQINLAATYRIPVILAVGQKVPRWPECHFPSWLDRTDDDKRQERVLALLREVATRYKDRPEVLMWQVENEPFLRFGECPRPTAEFYRDELSAVREADPDAIIIGTDGGEFGDWYRASRDTDVFGTTLYRKVHSDFIGHFTYPLTPEFFPLKSAVTRFFTGKDLQPYLVIELGMEPWTKKQIYELTPKQQVELFTPADWRSNVRYARQARFGVYGLWGVEWWYYLRTRGINFYWDEAKALIKGGTSPLTKPPVVNE